MAQQQDRIGLRLPNTSSSDIPVRLTQTARRTTGACPSSQRLGKRSSNCRSIGSHLGRWIIVPIQRITVSIFKIPTDSLESDGTLEWDKTTLVLVEAVAGGKHGLGYTYADTATATVIHDILAEVVQGLDAMSPGAAYAQMWRRVRNLGRPGICSMAISAVDCAIWDLKARLLGIPLVTLLGQVRDAASVYGSGGFTSYSGRRLAEQLSGWVKQGIPRVKMKIGRDANRDPERVRIAREAIGPEAELYVDANGAYSRKQALAQANLFTEFDVRWFEEPVSSDDLEGLRLLRDRAPVMMEIAAGDRLRLWRRRIQR